jgi:hypothetical protein
MMRTFTIAYILLTLLLILICSGCSNIAIVDPRCQARQHCIYTDPPAPIRTEVIRSSGSYMGDPAVR